MNKEEKKYNNHTRNQRRMFRIKKQEEKINDLKLLVGNLQSKLDNANKKLEDIENLVKTKMYVFSFNQMMILANEDDYKELLKIIGGE